MGELQKSFRCGARPAQPTKRDRAHGRPPGPGSRARSPSPTPIEDEGEFEDFRTTVVERGRRAGSEERELEPTTKKRRFSESVEKHYEQTRERRRRDDKGLLNPKEIEGFTFGGLPFEIRGGMSNMMTAKGGGSAPPYSQLADQMRGAFSALSEKQLAQVIVDILINGTMPGSSTAVGAMRVLGEFFAVVKGQKWPAPVSRRCAFWPRPRLS